MDQNDAELARTGGTKTGLLACLSRGNRNFYGNTQLLTAYKQNDPTGYNQTLKQLIDLLPKTDGQSEADPLLEFIKGGE